ncbi:4Fe-4S binding protein [Maridesulfovibrio hydrothermalis]|uniref:4Fe-4S ferredoxin iron-sulfur binding domain protein n=1 Tax=Maridesulfovibrio hydrothermalis AM13 = DSM 14728 TaxID=1121451 RepID=L0R9X7_9BACT|nr:4Fe-4S binding protein [Maridesulfovibrio hydrothermalis]CCO23554.1 4Fe-4S ferredoxin iron-sulfur binding domain protein [Maridesulfovibrio hydrothermalis AM13 = DSM 14728]
MKKDLQKFIPDTATGKFLKQALEDRNMSMKDVLHRYMYTRWPKAYIGAALGENNLAPVADFISSLIASPVDKEKQQLLKNNFAKTYPSKIITTEEAIKLIKISKSINTALPEASTPFKNATDFALQDPDHIVAFECSCRASSKSPCHPLDVCLIVGEPFASFAAKNHADKTRRITEDDAIRILEAENARGHVHHAFFKDIMLGRFYAICNCCPCCCQAMEAIQNGIPMLIPSGYIAVVDPHKCIGCGQCMEYCPFDAMKVRDKRMHINPRKCMGCGVCTNKCRKDALRLARNKKHPEPLLADKLDK